MLFISLAASDDEKTQMLFEDGIPPLNMVKCSQKKSIKICIRRRNKKGVYLLIRKESCEVAIPAKKAGEHAHEGE